MVCSVYIGFNISHNISFIFPTKLLVVGKEIGICNSVLAILAPYFATSEITVCNKTEMRESVTSFRNGMFCPKPNISRIFIISFVKSNRNSTEFTIRESVIEVAVMCGVIVVTVCKE